MYWEIDTFDRKSFIYVILEQRVPGGIRVRPEYQERACPACGRVDELKALRRGVSADIDVPKNLSEMVLSDDRFYIVATRVKNLLEKLGARAWFFKIPSTRNRWVIYPRTIFRPPPDTKRLTGGKRPKEGDVFQIRKGPCKVCGRLGEVTWMSEWFKVPRKVKLAGVFLDRGRTASLPLIVDDEILNALKAAKVSGWRPFPLGS